jgi:hypothetical protein
VSSLRITNAVPRPDPVSTLATASISGGGFSGSSTASNAVRGQPDSPNRPETVTDPGSLRCSSAPVRSSSASHEVTRGSAVRINGGRRACTRQISAPVTIAVRIQPADADQPGMIPISTNGEWISWTVTPAPSAAPGVPTSLSNRHIPPKTATAVATPQVITAVGSEVVPAATSTIAAVQLPASIATAGSAHHSTAHRSGNLCSGISSGATRRTFAVSRFRWVSIIGLNSSLFGERAVGPAARSATHDCAHRRSPAGARPAGPARRAGPR